MKTAAFRIEDLLDGLDVGQLLAALAVDETGFGLFVIGMIVAGLAAFYVALVVAPRVLVSPEDSGPWASGRSASSCTSPAPCSASGG